MGKVVVVGSVHADRLLRVHELPVPGQTVLAHGHARAPGGKGANQAVAAARLGATTAFIGQVGDDVDGTELRASLTAEGIDVSGVLVHPSLATGLAIVTVDDHGENVIIVSSGASGALTASAVRQQAAALGGADVTLVQLEVPLAAVEAAVDAGGGLLILNPAPAAELPASLLDHVDVLVPNRVELAGLVDDPTGLGSLTEVSLAAQALSHRCHVVVTLGAEGVLLVDGDHATHIPAPTVDVVDTTGAGDALCGALAACLADGMPLERAVRRSVRVAAFSTTRPGAQTAEPTPTDTDP